MALKLIFLFQCLAKNFSDREARDLIEVVFSDEGPISNINLDSYDINKFWATTCGEIMESKGHPKREIDSKAPKKRNPYYKKMENIKSEANSRRMEKQEYDARVARSGGGYIEPPDIKPLVLHYWEHLENAPSVKTSFGFFYSFVS